MLTIPDILLIVAIVCSGLAAFGTSGVDRALFVALVMLNLITLIAL